MSAADGGEAAQGGLTALVEIAEAMAFADFFRAAAGAAPELGMTVAQTAGATVLGAAAVPDWMFNRVLCLGLLGPVGEDTVAALVARYADACVPSAFQICPAAPQAAELTAWLRQRGARAGRTWTKMWRDDAPVRSEAPALRIVPASPDRAETLAGIVCTAFGLAQELAPAFAALPGRPGWHGVFACVGERPVAAAMLYRRERVAWLGMDATLPGERGRGAQGALMAARIEQGRALGCRHFVTETGLPRVGEASPSYDNMRRLAFTQIHARPTWVVPTPG